MKSCEKQAETYLERSSTIQLGSSFCIDSRECVVRSPRTFAPAARPAWIPAGASSTTRPMKETVSCHGVRPREDTYIWLHRRQSSGLLPSKGQD